MKMRGRRCFIGILEMLAVVCVFGCGADENKTALKTVETALNVDLSEGTLLEQQDSHGGFHGDGTSVTAVQMPDGQLENVLKDKDGWMAFPADQTVQALLYGCELEDGIYYGPFLTDSEGDALLPQVEDGWYYLENRQVKEGEASGADILHRNSFNFTISVYDADAKILYYCRMDT